MILTKITIAKRKEVKATTHPTHDLIASDEKYENKTNVGAMWTKVTDDGSKFLSGSLSKTRTGTDGKEYQGYVIITEKEYNEYQTLKNGTPKVGGYTGEVDVEDIPF